MDYTDAFDEMNDNTKRVRSIGWLLCSVGCSDMTPPPDTFCDLGELLTTIADRLDECERAFERGE